MNLVRRSVLKSLGAGGAYIGLAVVGMAWKIQAFAADWNKAAFEAKDVGGALKGLGATASTESKDLVIKAPNIAENGAVVPIDVVSNIPHTTHISILVEKNPYPLATSFTFSNGVMPEVSVRLKFSESSLIKVVAQADGKFYSAEKEVKVTMGGCGG